MAYNGYADRDAFHAALQARWAELRNEQREAELGHNREDDGEEGETPDSYLDRIDGHWYVCRYDRTLPQIHAHDCETCAVESR